MGVRRTYPDTAHRTLSPKHLGAIQKHVINSDLNKQVEALKGPRWFVLEHFLNSPSS